MGHGIGHIVGIKNNNTPTAFTRPDDLLFYIKWTDRSYIHCTWAGFTELSRFEGGTKAIDDFLLKSKRYPMTPSSTIPMLLTFPPHDIRRGWVTVERIVAESRERGFLVKWRELPYDCCTWEQGSDIPDQTQILAFRNRFVRSPPLKIEGPRAPIPPEKFTPMTVPIVAINGQSLDSGDLAPVEWLRQCWFHGRNSLFTVVPGLDRAAIIAVALQDLVRSSLLQPPFLIISMEPSLRDWHEAFLKWTPFNAVVYDGCEEARKLIRSVEVFPKPGRIGSEVLITTYDHMLSDFGAFSGVDWRYAVFDENRQMHSHAGRLYGKMQQISFQSATIVCESSPETPEEFWALLHFLHPGTFSSLPAFLASFTGVDARFEDYVFRPSHIHFPKPVVPESVLEVEMSPIQRTYYRGLLVERGDVLSSTSPPLPSLLGLVRALGKVCNHPYLFKGTRARAEQRLARSHREELDGTLQRQAMVDSCGKLKFLDAFLPYLRARGRTLAIVSQVSKMLDLLDDYFLFTAFVVERVDASPKYLPHWVSNPRHFVLLAGPQPELLAEAGVDTIVFYDSDLRCPVPDCVTAVYRLVTRATFETGILGCPENPHHLERLVRAGATELARDDDAAFRDFTRMRVDDILRQRVNRAQPPADISPAFWAAVMPHLRRLDASAGERPKRGKPPAEAPDDSLESPDPRVVCDRIMRFGCGPAAAERAAVLFLARAEPLDPGDAALLRIVLEVADLGEQTSDIAEAAAAFRPALEECLELREAVLARVILFAQVAQTLAVLQDTVPEWPRPDPLADYALLYGVHRNGIGPLSQVMHDIPVDVPAGLGEREILKSVVFFVTEFADVAVSVDRIPGTFLEPLEWREAQPQLFNRATFLDDELASLFQTLVYFGFPTNAAGEVDWARIARIARLPGIGLDALTAQGNQLWAFARDELDQDEEAMLCEKLGQFGNRIWTSRLKAFAADLARIRAFQATIGDAQQKAAKKVPEWDGAPTWWNYQYDLALVHALADYGLVYVVTWLVDLRRPFAGHIPEHSMGDYQALAEVERQQARPQEPRDVAGFGLLFGDKVRLARAVSVVMFVESRIARPGAGEKPDESEPEVEAPIGTHFTELPSLPFEAAPSLIVQQLGEFMPCSDVHPIGFCSHRQYFALHDPREKTWYAQTTELGKDRKILYRVVDVADSANAFAHTTSSGAWQRLIEAIQKVRGQMGLPKRKGCSVSGPFMFGFSEPLVIACFRLMKRKP
jgi:hypothetical protein